jgi:hypothetical protein
VDTDENRREFLAGLDRMQDWMRARQIPFVIVGSLAVAAHTGNFQRLDFSRQHAHDPTQRVPDIDLLVPRAALPAVHAYALAARAHARMPIHIDTFMAETSLDLRPMEQFSYLTHRTMCLPIESAMFGPRPAMLLDHELVTIDPRVLLHSIATGHPVIRKKDVANIVGLADAIRSGRAVSNFSERDCEVFSRFIAASWQRYPMFMAATSAWKRTLDALPPRASQALRSRLLPGIQRTVGALNRSSEPGGTARDRPDAAAQSQSQPGSPRPAAQSRGRYKRPGSGRHSHRSPGTER